MFGAAMCSAEDFLNSEGSKDPVVLVHGYCGSVLGDLSVELYWSFIGVRLKADGYEIHKITLPDGALSDVKRSADKLRDFVDDVLAGTGKSKVDIVAHSEGGLVSRYYIERLGGAGKVDDLVTLSTPHRGTSVAHIGPGEAARQMEIYSDFVRDLNAEPNLLDDIEYTIFVNNHDEIVVPGKNGFLEGAVNISVTLLGHAGILFNEPVYKMLRGAISNDIDGNHRAIPIEIVKDGMTTNNPNVNIRLKKFNHNHPDADIRQMKIANNMFLHGEDWHSFSEQKTWRIDDDKDGLKAVYVKFRESGNWLTPKESPTYVDYIFYDTHGPEGDLDVVPETTVENQVEIEIDASDNSDDYKELKGWNALTAYGIEDLGVKEMIVSTDPGFAGADWVPYKKKSVVDLTGQSGEVTVYAKVRDGAGNESAVMTDTVQIIGDEQNETMGMVSEAKHEPVILVHGYAGSMVGDVSVYLNWVYIYERLKNEGYDVTRITLDQGALQDVKVSARQLEQMVAEVKSRTGESKVDIVCHSEGGLVARYYIQKMDGAQNIDDLVTFSTPHRGTTVASIGPGLAARQMEVGSEFLQDLNSGETLPGDIEYTALFSHADEVVVPGKNGFFDGAININYTGFGHAGILFHPDPYLAMKNAISNDYLFDKGTRPVEIRENTMSTYKSQLEVGIRPCNHYSPNSPATEMKISTDPGFANADWRPIVSSVMVDVSGIDNELAGVFVKFRGADGVESPSYADYILIDRTPPEVSFSVSDTDFDNAEVGLSFSCSDNASKFGALSHPNSPLEAYGLLDLGCAMMIVGNDEIFTGSQWQPVTGSMTWKVKAGTGEKTIYARLRDASGNVTPILRASAYMFDSVNGYSAMESEKEPVVFVHGYMGSIIGDVSSYINWVYYVERLKAEGYSTHVVALSDGGLQDVTVSAAEVRDFVNGVLAETGASKVDIVCHSEGGLVARYYVKNLGGAAYVDDLITISTPHRGTTVAHIGPGKAARQMEVGSDFLAELDSGDSTPGLVDYTAIFTNDDTTVFPVENAFYDGALNINTNFWNHATILFNDQVYGYVKAALALDIAHDASQMPVHIIHDSMVTSDPNVRLKLNYYNHNAPMYPEGQVMICNNKLFQGAYWSDIQSEVDWKLEDGDGLKAVYVKYRDSQTGTKSPVYVDYIVLDRTPPSGAAIVKVDEDDRCLADLLITAADNSDDYSRLNPLKLTSAYGIRDIGIRDMMIWNSSDFVGAVWEPFVSNKKWALLDVEGDRNVYIKFRDASGNVSDAVKVPVIVPEEIIEDIVQEVEDVADEIIEEVADVVDTIIDVIADIDFSSGWTLFYMPDSIPDDVRAQMADMVDNSRAVFDISDNDFRTPLNAMNTDGGRALWVQLPQQVTQQVTFQVTRSLARKTDRAVMLEEGWNIVGISEFEPVSLDLVTVTLGGETLSYPEAAEKGIVAEKVLGYSEGEYFTSDEMLPFRAYLVRAKYSCFLNLP